MKAKQIIALLFVVALMPFAFAADMANQSATSSLGDDSNGLSIATQNEVQAMAYNYHGAQVRLLQLEKSIERNVLVGTQVVSEINASGNLTDNQSATLTNMQAALAEMVALKAQVQNVNPEQQNNTENAKQFVELKNDAITLTQQFREDARQLLTVQERQQLGSWIQANVNDNNGGIAAINARMRSEIQAYNAERVQAILNITGITNTTLVSQIQSGQLSVKDARQELKDEVRSVQKQKLDDLKAQLQDDRVKLNVYRKNVEDQVRETLNDTKQLRAQARIQLVQDAKLRGYLESRLRKGLLNAPMLGVGERERFGSNGTGNFTGRFDDSGRLNETGENGSFGFNGGVRGEGEAGGPHGAGIGVGIGAGAQARGDSQ